MTIEKTAQGPVNDILKDSKLKAFDLYQLSTNLILILLLINLSLLIERRVLILILDERLLMARRRLTTSKSSFHKADSRIASDFIRFVHQFQITHMCIKYVLLRHWSPKDC